MRVELTTAPIKVAYRRAAPTIQPGTTTSVDLRTEPDGPLVVAYMIAREVTGREGLVVEARRRGVPGLR